jgi:hypothetical protein
MSALGAAQNPRLAKRQGTIIGRSRLNRSVRVIFDGRKSPMSLHRDYIEQISSEAERERRPVRQRSVAWTWDRTLLDPNAILRRRNLANLRFSRLKEPTAATARCQLP